VLRNFALASTLFASQLALAHPVFDLVANRPLAHGVRSGGLVIATGTAGFARYVHFSRPLPTWKLRLVEDGKKVALPGTSAVLEVPLTASQASTPNLTFHLKSPAKQTIRATANGKASAAVPLAGPEAGWQTVTVKLPAGALAEGENKITLTFAQSGTIAGQKGSAAVEWIQVGGTAPDAEPMLADDKGLVLPKDGGLAYYVQVPDGGSLVATGDAGGCAVKVHAQGRGKRGVDAAWTSGQPIDLSSLAGQIVRLELDAEGASCTQAHLSAASLADKSPDPKVSYAKRPSNVIIWLTDSTRADKYRVYNPKTRVETPVMDAWAKKATVFKVGYVQGNESRVSHASLFTALYPAEHKFIAEKAKLNKDFVTLPEAIKPTGRATVGFMGNGFIDAFWGFGEGWDLLKNHIHDGGGLRASDLRGAAQGWLEKNILKPFFLYIGTIDAHVSWRAHEPWIAKYDPEPYAGPFVKACLDPQLDNIVAGKMKITDRDKQRIEALYDSDVSYNDQQFGELMKYLESKGHLEDTMVVLLADHGDEMYEHGKIGHGQSLHEELVHIPFVIYYPPLFPAGKVVDEGVELVDVLPTIVDALGGKPPADAQGESLVPLAQGDGAGYPRPAIASQYELAHTMRLGRWKLWVGGSGEVRLIDAATDPMGRTELQNDRPYERRFVTDALSLWMAYQSKWRKSHWGVASNLKPAFAAELDK
jgi:arylsulfatase A-like enzyme